MNVEMLQYFRYVAKYKNITSAAQHLYISQPTLSRQIMALEEELGVKLFERINKKMQLTQAGQVFYNDSESFAKHMQTVIGNVQAAGLGNTGVLNITLPMVLHTVLVDALAEMRRQYPSLQITLESYNFNEIPNAVRYNLYDAGLTYDFASFRDENGGFEHIGVLPLCTETFCLLVPKQYDGLQPEEVMQKISGKLPLILPSHIEPPFMKALLSQLQSYIKTTIPPNLSVNTTESVLLNVAAGLGFGLVPSSWAQHYERLEKVSFIELSGIPEAKCTVVLLYNESMMSQPTSNFVELMKKRAQPLA